MFGKREERPQARRDKEERRRRRAGKESEITLADRKLRSVLDTKQFQQGLLSVVNKLVERRGIAPPGRISRRYLDTLEEWILRNVPDILDCHSIEEMLTGPTTSYSFPVADEPVLDYSDLGRGLEWDWSSDFPEWEWH
jgi:hypothetical protein